MDLVSQSIDQLKDRIKSPLVLFFIIGWLHRNYDLVLYITSLDIGANTKIQLIQQYHMLSIHNMFLYPLGTAAFLYCIWYLLDALSRGLMERHGDLVRVISSHIGSIIYKTDTQKNKIKHMENIIDQLNSNYLSEKIRAEDLQRQIITAVKSILFRTPSSYALTENEIKVLEKLAGNYFIVRTKSAVDNYKFNEFKQRLQGHGAILVNRHNGDSNLMIIDITGATSLPPMEIIAETKYFGLEFIDRMSSLMS